MDSASPSDERLGNPSAFRSMPGAEPDAPGIQIASLEAIDPKKRQNFLQDMGLEVDRVASPDLLGQLEQSKAKQIDTLICSVLDTDPSVPFNSLIAKEFTREMAAGISLLAQLTSAPRVWVTADPAKTSAWFSQVEADTTAKSLRLVPLRGDYPQTDPALMLYTLLARRLAPGRLPTEKGAMLVDGATAISAGWCALHDSPCRITPLALRDHFEQKTHYVLAPFGVALADVCDFLHLQYPNAVFRGGDFLRDKWISPYTPLGSGELIIHATAAHLDANPDPCVHCGWCLEACPTRIHPAGLLDAAQRNDPRLAKKYGIAACIECGICSYVCPTRLPLLSSIRSLKTVATIGL